MNTLASILRKRLTTGLVVIVPVGVTLFVLRILYRFTSGIMAPVVRRSFENLHPFAVSLLSVLVLVMLLYLIGLVAANLLGHRLIAWSERLFARVPIAGTIYSATKQVIETIGSSDRSALKAVVMVEFPHKGSFTIGFLTGTIVDERGCDLAKIIVPTSPNPATGFLMLVPQADVRELGMSVEEAIKLVVSGGIIAPERLTSRGDAGPVVTASSSKNAT